MQILFLIIGMARHNEAKLASRAEEFLVEIKQKFDAQVFIQVGFPDRDGNLNVTS